MYGPSGRKSDKAWANTTTDKDYFFDSRGDRDNLAFGCIYRFVFQCSFVLHFVSSVCFTLSYYTFMDLDYYFVNSIIQSPCRVCNLAFPCFSTFLFHVFVLVMVIEFAQVVKIFHFII